MMTKIKGCRPVVVLIRDGWGRNPDPKWNESNAIHLARTPINDQLSEAYPHTLIRTSGIDVGLPDGVMGNSEVGHQNIGAGRIVEQEVMRITCRIQDGSFFQNEAILSAFSHALQTNGAVHLLGLCSDGRVHSDLDHIFALMDTAVRIDFPRDRLFLHAFMDGRDTPPNKGIDFIQSIESKCREIGSPPVASVIGRYYAMDRDNRWDRIEKAYRMLVLGEGEPFASAAAALQHYYDNPSEPSRSGDEFVSPSIIAVNGGKPTTIRDGDSVIFFNFRGDRPRQLTKTFLFDEFPFQDSSDNSATQGFDRGLKLDIKFVTMTQYEQGLPVAVAYTKPEKMLDILGAYIAENNLRQFRCAETEKYPHVTFFFNDYRDAPFDGEDRQLVPSPRDVTTYDQKPEMSAYEITDIMIERIRSKRDDLIILNYANGDMVGHTGNLAAAIRAVETVDECVGRVVKATLDVGGALIVTADHGNCEQMIHPETGGPHTAHTTYDVPLIVVGDGFDSRTLRQGGRLSDIAPTALDMLGLSKPDAMTGQSLLLPI